MNANDIVFRFADAFETLGIPYMLVGSFSSNFYGRARSTQDADFVVELATDSLAKLRQALGPDFQLDPQMSFETVTATTRYVIQHVSSAFKVEMFLLSHDPHDAARFLRRQALELANHRVWLPSAEDVIITKLRWSKGGQRSKDLADVAEVLAVQAGRLDLDYVRKWCDQHGTRDILERLLLAAS